MTKENQKTIITLLIILLLFIFSIIFTPKFVKSLYAEETSQSITYILEPNETTHEVVQSEVYILNENYERHETIEITLQYAPPVNINLIGLRFLKTIDNLIYTHPIPIQYGDANLDQIVNETDLQIIIDNLTYLQGDANKDGIVNFKDYQILEKNYKLSNKTWSDGDFNFDGIVDSLDYQKLNENYGKTKNNTLDPSDKHWIKGDFNFDNTIDENDVNLYFSGNSTLPYIY